MKKILYLLLVISTFTSAQKSANFNFSTSDIKDQKHKSSMRVLCMDDENLYTIFYKTDYTINSYKRGDATQTKTYTIDNNSGPFKGIMYLTGLVVNNTPYMFVYENTGNGVVVSYYTIDKNTLHPTGKTKIYEADNAKIENTHKGRIGLSVLDYETNVDIIQSPDKKTIYLVSFLDRGDKGFSNRAEVVAYNTKFEKLWDKELKIKTTGDDVFFGNIKADNFGGLYFTTSSISKRPKWHRDYNVYAFTKKNAEVFELDSKGNTMHKMFGDVYTDAPALVYAGFSYTSGINEFYHRMDGIYLSSIERDSVAGKLNVDLKVISLADEIIDPTRFNTHATYIRSNGDYIFIGEHEAPGGGAYGHIWILCYNTYGELLWKVPVIKKQSLHGSFKSLLIGNDVYIVYEDLEKNIGSDKEPEFCYIPAKTANILVLAKIDKDGQMEMNEITNPGKIYDDIYDIRNSVVVNDKYLVIPIISEQNGVAGITVNATGNVAILKIKD